MSPLPHDGGFATADVAEAVDKWAEKAHRDARTAPNVTVLDEGQVWSLHRLAERIHAAGYDAGVRVAETRARGEHQRRLAAQEEA